MKKIIGLLILSLWAFGQGVVDPASQGELKNISFIQDRDTSKLILEFDNPGVEAAKFQNKDDKQVIIDLKGVKASDRTLRAFDTSEFSGGVVFVSPYRKTENPKDIRIAVQLRDNVRSILSSEGNRLVLTLENRFGVFAQKQIKNTDEGSSTAVKVGEGSAIVNVPKSASVEDILENLTLSGRKRYIGTKIYFDVKNIAVTDLLKMISDASGFNIILGQDVNTVPPITLSLRDIPWDQALDTVLELSKLVATKNGNILIVKTLETAAKETKEKLEAEKLLEEQEPLVTKVFPISYSDIAALKTILTDYLTPEKGKVSEDVRTNNLIVKDTIEVIERVKRIIEVLDRQTPQVLIESKIVEVTEDYSKDIGLGQGLTFNYNLTGGSSIDTATDATDEFAFSTVSLGNNSNTFLGLTVEIFKNITNLDLSLRLLETETKGRIVSTPKIITQDKKKASIINTETTSFQTTTSQDAVTEVTFEPISVDLSLEVTPQVTNEGSIAMEVTVQKGSFSASTNSASGAPPDQNKNTIQTNVLVDNGSTVVIGGIYNYTETESHSGVPVLKDIPILGWLFRTPYNPAKTKSELLIFLTPRIINQEEAGLEEENPLG